jgi:hypothetical protein
MASFLWSAALSFFWGGAVTLTLALSAKVSSDFDGEVLKKDILVKTRVRINPSRTYNTI